MALTSPMRHQKHVVAGWNLHYPLPTRQSGETCPLFWFATFYLPLFVFFQCFLTKKSNTEFTHKLQNQRTKIIAIILQQSLSVFIVNRQKSKTKTALTVVCKIKQGHHGN